MKYEMKDALFFYAKCVEYMYRYEFSNPLIVSDNSISKIGDATLRNEKPLNKELFRAICSRFGITWIDEELLK